MHQPLYNSLVAKYVPRGRRSLAYGLSFTAGFGVGSVGSAFAGKIRAALAENPNRDLMNYGTLALAMGLAGMLALVLWRRRKESPSSNAK
jgi:hypothetical protein